MKEELKKITITDGSGNEHLWAEVVDKEKHYYKLANTPWFFNVAAYGDIVECKEVQGLPFPVFERVVECAHRKMVQLFFTIPREQQQVIIENLEGQFPELIIERAVEHFLSASVHDDDYERFIEVVRSLKPALHYSGDAEFSFEEIARLDNVRCACCGEQMGPDFK